MRISNDEIRISFTELEFIYLNEMLASFCDHGESMIDERPMHLHDAFVFYLEKSNYYDKKAVYESLYYFNDLLRTISKYTQFSSGLNIHTNRFNESKEFNTHLQNLTKKDPPKPDKMYVSGTM